MSEKKVNILTSFKDEISRLLIISIGVFLFVLFFQPFPLEGLDYNSRLLFVTGFGLIIFITASIAFFILPAILPFVLKDKNDWDNGPPPALNLIFLVITLTSFLFYIRYVGKTNLSLYIMFKTMLVALLPLGTLSLIYKARLRDREIDDLHDKIYHLSIELNSLRETEKAQEIVFYSDKGEKKLNLNINELIAIRSADNYIEVYYIKNESVEKILIRCTLKNIESQLIKFNNLIRCHRTSIVNKIHVEKITRSYSGYSLKIKGLQEKIPVSRNNYKLVKEILSDNT